MSLSLVSLSLRPRLSVLQCRIPIPGCVMAGGHRVCVPKMTGPLEPRLLGPRHGLPRAGSPWGPVMLPAVATLPAAGSTSFLEGMADGLAPLAEVGMDQIIPVLCHFYQMLQRENRLVPMIV